MADGGRSRPMLKDRRHSAVFLPIVEMSERAGRHTAGREAGPLEGLGSAARACLAAGVFDTALPFPTADDFQSEADELISEGLAGVALKLIDADSQLRGMPLRDRFR